MDVKEEFDNIEKYINKNKIIDKELLKSLNNRKKYLEDITQEFDQFWLKDYK